MEARAQLQAYRQWFEEPHNREKLRDRLGLSVYKPSLMVVIGRADEFRDQFERGALRADNPDLELVTYDDILAHARRRRLIIEEEGVD